MSPLLANSDSAKAVVVYTTNGHDGSGWYYYDSEYPDEGSIGAFTSVESATEHAEEAGYVVEVASSVGGDAIPNQEQTMKDALIQLLSEVPADTIVFRPLDGLGGRSAGQMIQEIKTDTELGRQYGSDLLRVARDFLKRQIKG